MDDCTDRPDMPAIFVLRFATQRHIVQVRRPSGVQLLLTLSLYNYFTLPFTIFDN
jgi:hypothetical protein